MRLAPRLAAALGGLALALGGVVAAAPAAHATPQACYYHVLEKHPGVNPQLVADACLRAADGEEEHVHACYFELRRVYVPAMDAMGACRRSSQE